MSNLNLQTLRRVAWIGLAVVLVVDFLLSTRATAGANTGAVVLLVLTLLTGLAAWLLLPEAAGTLLRHKDLLVPFALAVVANKLILWVSMLPLLGGLLGASLPLHLFNLSLALSLGLLLYVVVSVAYAVWMTATLLEFARSGNPDPCRMLASVPRHFWRVFGLQFICWAAVMLAVALMLALMPALSFFALLPLAVFAVVWNLATAALLPVALEHPGGFWDSFRDGVRVSWGQRGRWWMLIMVQLLLLGVVFYYHSRHGGSTNTSWSINVFWTGGYAEDGKWYSKLAEAMKVTRLPLVETLLALLFGAFAVAIKLAIVQRLQPEPPPLMADDPAPEVPPSPAT
ncbi:MAG: hypothetical protein QM813_13470 [Verrucomicrobiota bacterium]